MRLAIMSIRNIFIWKRNQRRRKLADEVGKMKQDVGSPSVSTITADRDR